MKIEFGLRADTNEIVLADVIDNDSWRIWPSGDKRLMKDKQVYRNLKQKMTEDDMINLKGNYKWVSDHMNEIKTEVENGCGRIVIIMGSASDMAHCEKIRKLCSEFGLSCEFHVSSAHKSTNATLKLLSRIESEAVSLPTVIIAVAGRSNGLGPVLSGNTSLPVINCPPLGGSYANEDVWSSLRMPSGLGCTTVITVDAAAHASCQILAQHDVGVWCKLRAKRLNTWVKLRHDDEKVGCEDVKVQ
jgi:phosphoribosylaminoimidazole carboxylase/phosphoribosylaminoimidazole-succinocarboxamide synthase